MRLEVQVGQDENALREDASGERLGGILGSGEES